MAASESIGTSNREVPSVPLAQDGPAHGDAHDHGGHGHGSGGDHVPHVLPLWIYIATWLTLMVLTGVTVGASYINFGGSTNLLIALSIATVKGTTVALMFMHLRYDHKFHGIIFSFSLIFLAIFIGFTMYDTETRGRTDAVERDRSANVKAPFKATLRDGKIEKQMRRDYGMVEGQPAPAPPEPPR